MLGFNIRNLAIIEPAADIYNPEVVRSSMGSIFSINFEHFRNFSEYKNRFTNNIYCFMTDGEKSVNEVKFNKPLALVFGNEGSGLPKEFKDYGISVRIPQSENIDSLNLAISVGIGLYEAMKQSNH
jgi:TrmH family RNA methyltransferase